MFFVPLAELIRATLAGMEEKERAKMGSPEVLYELYTKEMSEIKLLNRGNVNKIKHKLTNKLTRLLQMVKYRQIAVIPGYDGTYGKLVDTDRMIKEKVNMAGILFESSLSYERAWKDAKRVQELMKSGEMIMTQHEYEELSGSCGKVP